MIGDTSDITLRIRSVLPARWFPDSSPVLQAVVTGLATAWASIYALLAFVRLQSRLQTATGIFLDAISADFFGTRLGRRTNEPDDLFRQRVLDALRREHATRPALQTALQNLTGRPPRIFEPSRPADTGAYCGPALGYGAVGAWGSLLLPYQAFVLARRPERAEIANVAGYGTGGPLSRVTLTETGGYVTNAEIYATITSVMPTATIAWTCITN